MPYQTKDEYMKVVDQYLETLNDFEEVWVPLVYGPICKDSYMISNHGRIYSNLRKTILKPIYRKSQVNYGLRTSDGKPRSFIASRLVASTFIQIPSDLIEQGYDNKTLIVLHKDGIVHHNATFNLEWTVRGKTTAHAHKLGLINHTKINTSHVKLTTDQIHLICQYLEKELSIKEIVNTVDFEVTPTAISNIKNGMTRSDISKQYNIKRTHKPHLSHAAIDNIIADINNDKNISYIELAIKYNVSEFTIRRIAYKYSDNIVSRVRKPRTMYKYSDELIHAVCKDIESGEYTLSEISKKHVLPISLISAVKTHKSRTSISKNYNF